MRIHIIVRVAVSLIGCASCFLFGQSIPKMSHVDERALDALATQLPKWWAEVQRLIRDHENPVPRVETARYLLSRPFVWRERDPRDSETRSATTMLAAEVAEALEPNLATKPDHRQILTSQDYRSALIAALPPSSNPLEVPMDSALNEMAQKGDPFIIPPSSGSNKIRIPKPPQTTLIPAPQSKSSIVTGQTPQPASASTTSSPVSAAAAQEAEDHLLRYLWITGGVLALSVLVWLAVKKRR